MLFSLEKEGDFNTGCKLGKLMLSEINQSQKDKHCIISLIYESTVTQITETESRAAAAGAGRRGMRIVYWAQSSNFEDRRSSGGWLHSK